jgi:hypothetical protein
MSHQLGANGIEELLHVVHKNASEIGKLEEFSSRFELNAHHPIYPVRNSHHLWRGLYK